MPENQDESTRDRPAGARPDPNPDRATRNRLFDILYEDLRRSARFLMRRELNAHTLSPTVLVHEAYLRLVNEKGIGRIDRARFLSIAAQAMRRILVEHARARNAQKRGGGWRRVTIETRLLGASSDRFDALALHDALDALAREDERAAEVTEMKVFGGLSHDEIAGLLGVSRRTVDGDWAYARKWLSRAMK